MARGGCGTVFKIMPQGALTTLFNFQQGSNGCNPDGGLIVDTGGDIHGSTTNAGSDRGGTIFRVSPAGTLTTNTSSITPMAAIRTPHSWKILAGLSRGQPSTEVTISAVLLAAA
ncbi:MAG: choice-of-anchor tandem repeat GloVer-containing protein [Terriglobales bacterium]